MEIEKMKEIWKVMENRMEGQEVLQRSMIKEMLTMKSGRSVSKLLNLELFGSIIILLTVPFIYWVWYRESGRSSPHETLLLVFLIMVEAGTAWQLYKTWVISRYDPKRPTDENIRTVNRYEIMVRRERISILAIVPVLLFVTTYWFARWNVYGYMWAVLASLYVLVIVLLIYFYKKVYPGNIAAIRDSLEEMRELDG